MHLVNDFTTLVELPYALKTWPLNKCWLYFYWSILVKHCHIDVVYLCITSVDFSACCVSERAAVSREVDRMTRVKEPSGSHSNSSASWAWHHLRHCVIVMTLSVSLSWHYMYWSSQRTGHLARGYAVTHTQTSSKCSPCLLTHAGSVQIHRRSGLLIINLQKL